MSWARGRSSKGRSATRRLQLGDELGVASQLELGVDEVRLGGRAQLLEPRRLEPGEGLVGEVGQRRPAPEPERLAQLRRASVRASVSRASATSRSKRPRSVCSAVASST